MLSSCRLPQTSSSFDQKCGKNISYRKIVNDVNVFPVKILTYHNMTSPRATVAGYKSPNFITIYAKKLSIQFTTNLIKFTYALESVECE